MLRKRYMRDIMKNYEETGIVDISNLKIPTDEQLHKGVAITECLQPIPCNPCKEVCPTNAIKMDNINDPPDIDYDRCIGCALCVEVCPGLAMFVVRIRENKAMISLPYEMLPIPERGQAVKALDREGKIVGDAVVKAIKRGRTNVVTVEVDKNLAMIVRNIKVEK